MKKIDTLNSIQNTVGLELNADERKMLHHLSTGELTALDNYLKRAREVFEKAEEQFLDPTKPAPTDELCPMHGKWPENPAPGVVCTCNRPKPQFDPTLEPDANIGEKPPCPKCQARYGESHLPSCPEYPAYLKDA